ncbi:uncharacterized protein METZ01_LOCUS125111 [marine metagenome]|uniref:Uncharacterized protein n=1 Tax=marine metagenome TaxID=408172 RepID=A0A381Y785_9ZZZZ
MTPIMEPPLASAAIMAMAFTQVPIRRPATQYWSRDASTFREASTPMAIHPRR